MTNEKINIIFPSSDYYIPYTLVMMTSILLNKNKEDRIFFHIISEFLSDYSISSINDLKNIEDFDLEIKIVKPDLISDIVTCAQQRIGNICNYKLFLSTLFDFDKAIVLEGDMIVLKSLSELYAMNIDQTKTAICAVVDPICNTRQSEFNIPKEYRYCNTGVILANLKLWRELDIESEFISIAKYYGNKLELPDQDIFNIALYKNIRYLPLNYNVYASVYKHNFPEEDKLSREDPIIIHWADYRKPWEYLEIDYAFLFWKYARLSPNYELITYRLNNLLYKRITNEKKHNVFKRLINKILK